MNNPNPTQPPAEERAKQVHFLKTWSLFFAAVREGRKPFEARRDDRDYQVGDLLVLQEWNPETQEYTGEEERRDITYVLRGTEHVALGFCILGLRTNDVAAEGARGAATASQDSHPPPQPAAEESEGERNGRDSKLAWQKAYEWNPAHKDSASDHAERVLYVIGFRDGLDHARATLRPSPVDAGRKPFEFEEITEDKDGKISVRRLDSAPLAAAGVSDGERSELIRNALTRSILHIESENIDWALFSPESQDYDPNYKPEFPPIVDEMRSALAAMTANQPEG